MADSEAASAPLHHRIAWTFLSPRRLVPELREGVGFLAPLAIATLVAVLSVYLLPQEFFVEQMAGAVNRRGQPVEITSSPGEIARWGRYLGMLTALVAHPLFALALAGLLSLLFTTLGPGRTTFRQHLGIVAHAFLVAAAGALATAMLQWVTGDPLARFTPAAVAPSMGRVATLLLEGVDLFTVWMLVLVGYWLAAIETRVSVWSTIGTLLGLYLLIDVATALLAS